MENAIKAACKARAELTIRFAPEVGSERVAVEIHTPNSREFVTGASTQDADLAALFFEIARTLTARVQPRKDG